MMFEQILIEAVGTSLGFLLALLIVRLGEKFSDWLDSPVDDEGGMP